MIERSDLDELLDQYTITVPNTVEGLRERFDQNASDEDQLVGGAAASHRRAVPAAHRRNRVELLRASRPVETRAGCNYVDAGGGSGNRRRFDHPYRHARHYLGWTTNLDARLQSHRRGNGSRLISVITAAGVDLHLVQTWRGDRNLERRIKTKRRARPLLPRMRRPSIPRPRRDHHRREGNRSLMTLQLHVPEDIAHVPAQLLDDLSTGIKSLVQAGAHVTALRAVDVEFIEGRDGRDATFLDDSIRDVRAAYAVIELICAKETA
jgi:hypothetical protein